MKKLRVVMCLTTIFDNTFMMEEGGKGVVWLSKRSLIVYTVADDC